MFWTTSVEVAICELYNLEYPFKLKRKAMHLLKEEIQVLANLFGKYKPEQYLEHVNGYGTFRLSDDSEMSVKQDFYFKRKVYSNKGTLTINEFVKFVKDYGIEIESVLTEEQVKKFIRRNIKELLVAYLDDYFIESKMLYVTESQNKPAHKLLDNKDFFLQKIPHEFSFSQTIDSWSSSCTLYLVTKEKKYSIGQFTVDKKVKFQLFPSKLMEVILKYH